MNHFIGIMADNSPHLLAGLLGILKSGDIFVPINPTFPVERIHFIIKDCNIRLLLTDKANYGKGYEIATASPIITHLICLDEGSSVSFEKKSGKRGTANKPLRKDEFCYVIYTSGSTGKPKGVPIKYYQLSSLLLWFREYFKLGKQTKVFQNLSYSFDYGVFELFSSLLSGGTLFFFNRYTQGDFTTQVQLINKNRINTIHTTPAFFNGILNVKKKIPGLELVHLGGERLTCKILQETAVLVSPQCRIYNGYGPTETTINCAIFGIQAKNVKTMAMEKVENIPIGKPSAFHEIFIMDRFCNPRPIGAAGELCIAGPGVSQGYLNNPELTVEKFGPQIALMTLMTQIKNKSFARVKGPAARGAYKEIFQKHPFDFYRTGDLARWLPDGNIEFLGRMDQQVKIRGFRIELGEIEIGLSLYPGIKETLVTARQHENGSNYLCAYFISQITEHPSISQLREFLSKWFPDYMIPAYFIHLEKFPLTANGKIDRKALPEPDYTFIDTGIEYIAPATETEKRLAIIWKELLRLEKIGIADDFFQLGGDSILVNRCIARIREELLVEISLRKFFEQPFIKALSKEIEKQERQLSSIKPMKRVGEIPLSFAQERLWFLQELDADNAAYFVPRVIRIKGNLDAILIERTFTEIICRHEILRTTFHIIDGHPVQQIQSPHSYPFRIIFLDWSSLGKQEQDQQISNFLSEEGRRPFDFEHGPLLRVTLLKLTEKEHLFVLTEHHLVHDGWTQGVLLSEFIQIFTAYFEGREHNLPALPIQYADYAIWERNYLKGDILEKHLNYWKKKLAGLPPVLELPTDRPRPPVISGQGRLEVFHLPGSITLALKKFSRQNGATLFMAMLAIFKTLLYRYTGVNDLCVGTGIANRRYKEMEGMLGMVINTLPLRTQVSGGISFKQYLSLVKETCLEAYQHEDTPFGKIVEAMQPERNLHYMPLFQVLFSFMDTPGESLRLPGLELELLPIHNRSAKFDINVVVVPPPEHEGNETAETLVEWEYNTDIFAPPFIQQMVSHYNRLLEEGLENPETLLSNLPMMSAAEMKQVLYEFNETETVYPREKTIHQLFAEQVEITPDRIALVGAEAEGEEKKRRREEEKSGGVETLRATSLHITYLQLNEQSGQLAGLLIEKGVLTDDIVGIMMERSIGLIISILGILKAGGAYLPIDPDYPPKRIDYMLNDSRARIILGKAEEQKRGRAEKNLASSLPRFLTSGSSSLAYIIYTSGSTGQPKGVMVTHRNVVRLVKNTNFISLTKETRILQTGAPIFDATTFEIWGSLLNGGELLLVDKEIFLNSFLMDEALQRYHSNTLWLSASLFNQLQQQGSELFRSLKYLLVGGDVLSPDHINPVRQQFLYLKIINGYGPTENTTFSTTYLIEKKFEHDIPIGRPIANSTAYIKDKNRQLVPIGIWGELYVGGDGVSRGYLNNPELTCEKFGPQIALMTLMTQIKSKSFFKGSRGAAFSKKAPLVLYKTGDRVRWLRDGNIEFLGRIDQQIKIRGFRIELPEIESRLLRHKQIKEAAVIARKTGSEKYLCAYIVLRGFPGPSASELKSFLSGSLPGYMIPSYFLFMDKFPLNPNGKIDRKALPEPGDETAVKVYVSPRDTTEQKLAEIWTDVLKPGHPIGIDDNFFDLGGHSLNAAFLTNRMHKIFHIKIPLMKFFQRGCIRGVAEYIKETAKDDFAAVEPVEKKEYYPLSAAQKRLYILWQMDETSIAYNIPAIMQLEGELDKNYLEEVFKQLIHRHESLRTSFIIIDGNPVQRVHEHAEFVLAAKNAKDREDIYHFIRVFDLSNAPLLRVTLIKEENSKYLLTIDMHHIITDGISMELFVKEFMGLYEGMKLPPLKLQYKDYSGWLNSEREKNVFKAQEKYWQMQFGEMSEILNLPLDYPRPAVQSFAGSSYLFEINAAETSALKALASKEGTTLYMVLLTIYYIFLSRLTGQEDIVIGTPVSGRSHADLENIIGMFVNTLALRNQPVPKKNATGFLKEVNDNTLTAFANQDYPYEELVEKVSVHRDTGRNPLYDTMLNLRNMDISEIKIPGLTMTPFPFEANISKFDLTLRAFDGPMNLCFTFEYCTKLFKRESMERFGGFVKTIIAQVIREPQTLLGEIEIISEEEKKQLLIDFNNMTTDYPRDKTMHQLFAEQVSIVPDRVAVFGHGQTRTNTDNIIHVGADLRVCPDRNNQNVFLTYNELNEQSDQLAVLLIERGVLPDSIVGIMMEPCIDLIISILSILKSGGAYLPIDPNYPQERINYMLKDSGARILINKSEIRNPKLEKNPNNQNLNDQNKNRNFEIPLVLNFENLNFEFVSNFVLRASNFNSSNLAYIIYTSGSTGMPKGVPITHANISPLLYWGFKYLDIKCGDRVIQNLSYYFDWSVMEIFLTLVGGASLYMATRESRLDPTLKADLIDKNMITVLYITPTQYSYLVNLGRKLETLRYLFLGAEKLTLELLKRSFESVGESCRIFNMYGPTETTIISLVYEINRNEENKFVNLSSVPIGKAIAKGRVLVLDNSFNLCPVNIPGELYIGGDGVAAGYLNNPELTAEKFGPQIALMTQMTQIKSKSFFKGSRGAAFSKKAPLVLYKTGDLARWLADGNIEFLGRIDHQVKIRGFRIELGEIENHLLTHDKIKDAVVITKADQAAGQDQYLICAYFTADEKIDSSELREYLSITLPEYMIPVYFVQLNMMPLTPNGKLDRKALPEPVIKASEGYAAARTEIERKMVVLWSEILGRVPTSIGIDDNFFQLGGHSLKASILAAKIHKIFAAKLPLTEIFKTPRIRELSEYIKNVTQHQYEQIVPAEKKEFYGLSSAQKRLYFLQQMDKDATAYNISAAWVLEGNIDKNKLENAFIRLIKRHESFRTLFVIIGKEPVQRIYEEVEFEIDYNNLATDELGLAQTFSTFIRAFDLSKTPLLRVRLEKITGEKHLLMVDMHHIISDGMSIQILVQDFSALYQEKKLPGIRLQYKDYTEWQFRERETKKNLEQGKFWANEFEGEIPILELPTDYARPAVQRFEGNRIHFEISIAVSGVLKKLALKTGTTLYIVLLALYNIFLAKLSGMEDIVIGTPAAGRQHADLEVLVGIFVNTLALRNYPSQMKKWLDFLQEVKETTLKALENQDFQYEELVERISVNRDLGRNPLFDTMFDLQNTGSQKLEIPGLALIPYEYENKTSKFDLSLSALEVKDKLLFTFEYSTKLFRQETVERFAGYFKQLITSVLDNDQKEITIVEIELITNDEKTLLLYDFNNNVEFSNFYPSSADKIKTINELFVEQVEKSPDNIAVVYAQYVRPVQSVRLVRPVSLTYQELNKQSGLLAELLIEKGVLADDIVGIMAAPSLEMVIGLWGILKAGGAYMPIDPEYPPERIDYMLEDSNAKVLIINKSEIRNPKLETNPNNQNLNAQNKNQNFEIPLVLNFENLDFEFVSNFVLRASNFNSSNLAYIIYTSGTTGKPKGVMVEHRNLAAYVQFYADKFKLQNTDAAAQQASFTFDAFVEELYPILIKGGKTVIFPKEGVRDIEQFADAINRFGITIISASPLVLSHLNRLNRTPGVRLYAIGGDVLKSEYMDNLLKTSAVYNGYGPTETTVCATFYKCIPGNVANVSIGKPIRGYRVYILNRYYRLQPVGVPGELCISGSGVTRGYLNRPELTCEKFLKNHRSYRCHRTYIFYQTGDLAKWLPDGNLEFLGRIDTQVKIRGFRVELGEIEKQLLKHPKIKESVVIDRDDNDGNKYLCAYIIPVPGSIIDENQIREFLRLTLPHYMVPSFFVSIEQLPLTASGKPDRKRLPEPGMGIVTEYIPPRNEIEEKIVNVWNEILGRDKLLGINDNFFHVGGDSIKAIHVAARLKEYHLDLKINDLFLHPVISELSAFVIKIEPGDNRVNAEVKYETTELDIPGEVLSRIYRHIQDNIGENLGVEAVYPLTPMQKTMLYHDLGGSNKGAFFIQLLSHLEGTIDPTILKTTMQKLVERHGVYRTIFIYEGLDEPLQAILKQREIEFVSQDISGWQEEKKTAYLEEYRENDIKRGFDITKDMLLRVALFKIDAENYYLVWSNHYIVEDGWCTAIVFGDLYKIYGSLSTGSPLELPGTTPYCNYIYWLEKQDKEAGLHYWREYLAGYKTHGDLIPVIPNKIAKGTPASYQFTEYNFIIAETDIEHLKQLAADCRVTLNIVFQTLWGILLQMYNNREDVVFGAVVSGRTPEITGIETMVGLLINTVPVRVKAERDLPLPQLLKQMQANSVKAKSYEYLPLTEILSACELKANIIDSLMTFQNFWTEEQPGIGRPAFRAKSSLFHQSNYNFNIIIYPLNPFEIRFMYNASVHDEIFCKRIEEHLKEIIRQVIAVNNIVIKDIQVTLDYIAADEHFIEDEEDEWNI